jgi:hypothetical protein
MKVALGSTSRSKTMGRNTVFGSWRWDQSARMNIASLKEIVLSHLLVALLFFSHSPTV